MVVEVFHDLTICFLRALLNRNVTTGGQREAVEPRKTLPTETLNTSCIYVGEMNTRTRDYAEISTLKMRPESLKVGRKR